MQDNELTVGAGEFPVVKIEPDEKAIGELRDKYLALTIKDVSDVDGYKAVDTARKHVKSIRCGVERDRKEKKSKATTLIEQFIDGPAKKLIDMVRPIEDHLAGEQKRIDDEKEKAAALERQRKQEAINARVYAMVQSGATITLEEAATLSEQEFDDRLRDAIKRQDEERKAKEEEARKLAEEKAAIEAEKKAIAEEKARLAELRRQDEEKQRAEAEKLRAAQAEEAKVLEQVVDGMVEKAMEGQVVDAEFVEQPAVEPVTVEPSGFTPVKPSTAADYFPVVSGICTLEMYDLRIIKPGNDDASLVLELTAEEAAEIRKLLQ